jgi:hypothetical protein
MIIKNLDAVLVSAHLRNLGATYVKQVHRSPLEGFDVVRNDSEPISGKRLQVVIGDPADHAEVLANPADFLVFSDDSKTVKGLLGPKANAVVVPTGIEPDRACTELDELFRGTTSFASIAQRTMEVLQGTNLLRDYLDIASDELGNPCAIFDSASHCIETNSNPMSGGVVWNAAMADNLNDLTERDRMWLIEGLPDLAATYPYPEIVSGSPGEGRAAIMGLDLGEKMPFIFAVQEYEESLSRDMLPAMWYIGNFLAYHLRNQRRGEHSDGILAVLEDIAYRTERDPRRIARRISNTGFEVEAGSHIVVFRNFASIVSRSQLGIIQREATTQLGSPAVISGDEVVTLVGRGKDDAIRQLVSPGDRPAWRKDFCCGISYPLESSGQLPKALTQAEEAILWGDRFEPKKRIHEFRSIVFCSMVNNLKDEYSPYDFCDPKGLAIVDYDKHNGTHLAATLYVYLKEIGRTKRVAEHLGIHHNSVLYRIKKVKELFGLDFDNSYDLNTIERTFDILVSIPDNEEDRRLLLPIYASA